MPQRSPRRNLELEVLEDRQLLATQATLGAGILHITGTRFADTAVVTRQGDCIQVQSSTQGDRSPRTQRWMASQVTSILFEGSDGNDTFTNDTSVRSTAYGGAGNDTLTGGSAADQLCGDDGNDRLLGRGGDDTLYGGRGKDYLYGGAGSNALYGGAMKSGVWNGFDGESVDTYRFDFNPTAPFVNGASLSDVYQGISPTCPIVAALASAARAGMPLAQGIRYLGNQRYQVRLYDASGKAVYQTVTFDGTWTDNDAQPARDAKGRQLPEFWVVLYQRAYLQYMNVDTRNADANQWVSTTGKFWNSPQLALSTITGKHATWTGVISARPETLQTALQQGRMVLSLTKEHGTRDGIVDWHVYVVTSVTKVNGTWQVKMSNPWGFADDESQSGSVLDHRPDGTVTIPWWMFTSNFQGYAMA